MTTTKIFPNPAFGALRALVLSELDRVKFRHHGIGVLQGYVRENAEPEVRIHIWSPRLLKPGMAESGDVHDHRFDMISHVLSGAVEHEEWMEMPDPAGDHAMMSLTHARAAADNQYHGPTTALEGRYVVVKQLHTIGQGYSYSFPAKQFHRSPIRGGDERITITCVEKHGQTDAPARLLYPADREPVMAFGHTPDQKVIDEIVAMARWRLA